MTTDEMPECAGCGARYTSPLAAVLCCAQDDYDRDPWYDLSNN
jgi:hypothetical protein